MKTPRHAGGNHLLGAIQLAGGKTEYRPAPPAGTPVSVTDTWSRAGSLAGEYDLPNVFSFLPIA